jgi:cation diffusion facilitator CzcD-associated flavoprotein CzcO
MERHFDVLIVGAGLSGVGAAWHLRTRLPGKSFCILEGRERIGGTWDLFRYPGVRSDSDMFTLGYGFRPWRDPKAIAGGPAIRAYIEETAAEAGIVPKIRFNHWVTDASWSSETRRWTVTAVCEGRPAVFTCDFLWMCSGYYRYAEGYTPDFLGVSRYRGLLVHPQRWPEDLDYAGKRIVVIGSGATAVTLIPSLTDKAAHVVMLQRSPSYMFAMPSDSALAKFLVRTLGRRAAFWLMRWQRVLLQQFTFRMARARPQKTRERLLQLTREKLPEGYDIATHFSPRYNPWEQRLCLVPDDDLFAAIREGKASVETGEIETFTEGGIRLKSGKELAADIVVTATGLVLEVAGGAAFSVDGRKIDFGKTFTYKGMMFSGVPNMAATFGYTNASWTLRADLVSEYVCRLLAFMERKGLSAATPVPSDADMTPEPFLDFSSGYVTRAAHYLPKQGKMPWRHPQNYAVDLMNLRFGRLDDGELRFSTKAAIRAPAAAEAAAA